MVTISFRRGLGAVLAAGLAVGAALTVAPVAAAPAVSAESATQRVACGYVNASAFPAPATKSWVVDGAETLRDATGAEVRAFAGYMVDQAIVRSGSTTFLGFFDATKHVAVAKQTGSGPWQVVRLDAVLDYDSHSNVALAVDKAGNVHVTAKTSLQDKRLRYWVTAQPGDIATLKPAAMMPSFGETRDGVYTAYEDLTSYPRFYTGPTGDLFFRYRSGSADGAWTIVYRYDVASRSWGFYDPASQYQGLAKVWLGYNSNPQVAAYPSDPVKGPDGWYHLIWTWRDDPTAGTNTQVHYAKSPDLLVWYDSAGRTIPNSQFTLNQAQTMVDPVPFHGGLLNDSGMALGFDPAGKPVVSYFKYAGSGAAKTTQLFVARPASSGTGWTVKQATNWTGLYDLENWSDADADTMVTANMPARPVDGRIGITYVCQGAVHQLYIDPQSGETVADIPGAVDPDLPAAVTSSAFAPGYKITWRTAATPDSTPGATTLLKWEAGPYIHDDDLSRVGPYPAEGSPLTVFRLRQQ